MATNFIPNMLVGSSAGETLSVTATKFVLIGMGGNDTLIGGAGRDLLFGDYFSTTFLNALMNDQTVTPPPYDFTLVGNDSLVGGGGADLLIGDQGNDTLNAGDGDDDFIVVVANFGNDVFQGGAGWDILSFEDTYQLGITAFRTSRLVLDAAAGVEVLEMGSFGLTGTGGDDLFDLTGVTQIFVDAAFAPGIRLQLLGGNDVYRGSSIDPFGIEDVADRVFGGTGDDTLLGGIGSDSLFGGAGNDRLNGEAVAFGYTSYNELFGGSGNDRLVAAAAGDSLYGGDGNDTLDGRFGYPLLDGGAGDDVYYFNTGAARPVIEHADSGHDTVYATSYYQLPPNFEDLIGTKNSSLSGFGNSLDNRIIGGNFGDALDGGRGNDMLTGGGGHDRFDFSAKLVSGNVDTVTDFQQGVDSFGLFNQSKFGPNTGVFGALPVGLLAASAFKVLGAGVDADDRILYDQVSGKIFYDVDGNGVVARELFALVSPGVTLTSTDFLVI